MKKLIVLSVVFALVAGVAFAVELTGSVVGNVAIETDSKDGSPVKATGGAPVIRLAGSGELDDGKFGGFIRLDGDWAASTFFNSYQAWWKPIEQVKVIIGRDADGFWGKEGVTGWNLHQTAIDSVAINHGIWGGGVWDYANIGFGNILKNRYVFFGGSNVDGLGLEIKPMDMFAVNISVPFFNSNEAKYVFEQAIFQLDVNVDFGNIALTYQGGANKSGAIFAYYGGTFGDIGLDVGLSYHYNDYDVKEPIGIGLGLKYAAGAFGVKFRVTTAFGGDDKVAYINASVVPSYAINDSATIFLNAGLAMVAPDDGDAFVGYYVNPYLRIGAEWGPTFYFGIQLSSDLSYDGYHANGDKSFVNFSVPIGIQVSF